jgi:hypothetical protein
MMANSRDAEAETAEHGYMESIPAAAKLRRPGRLALRQAAGEFLLLATGVKWLGITFFHFFKKYVDRNNLRE